MKVALVGLGGAAVHGHLPALRALEMQGLLNLVAAADHALKPRTRAEVTLRGVPVFTSAESMLASVESDILIIATEPSSHARLIELAFGHGVHVVCEKPLVVTQHHLAIAQAAARGSRELAIMTTHQYRYSSTWIRVSPWIRAANALGMPFSMLVEVGRPGVEDPHAASDWRTELSTSGGVLADHGAHFIALAWMIDSTMSVLGGGRTYEGVGSERSWARIRVGSGVLELRMSTASSTRRSRVEVRVPGVSLDWQGGRAALRVAGRGVASWRAGALSDRDYLDSLYPAFYRDCLHNLSDNRWRVRRSTESLDVGAVLVDLIARLAE